MSVDIGEETDILESGPFDSGELSIALIVVCPLGFYQCLHYESHGGEYSRRM
jgi:hypothetical protein